jgi:COMPASS component SWD2
MCGSSDGKIHIWNVEKGNKVAVLNSEHSDTIQSIQFNPKFMMFASTCQQMVCLFPNNTFHHHISYLKFLRILF